MAVEGVRSVPERAAHDAHEGSLAAPADGPSARGRGLLGASIVEGEAIRRSPAVGTRFLLHWGERNFPQAERTTALGDGRAARTFGHPPAGPLSAATPMALTMAILDDPNGHHTLVLLLSALSSTSTAHIRLRQHASHCLPTMTVVLRGVCLLSPAGHPPGQTRPLHHPRSPA
ncbi:hypothetical protein AVW11_04200 [Streptomyces amritsarensis]|uniref:Uncharacterized protein n=1 Tax=Streptomyces amritsarensis TaxID=681158 RepID=A0ABX3GCH0_9ACTN|nr:hypothetical protein AVW11_04200 [Streptomyces amritsarensis]